MTLPSTPQWRDQFHQFLQRRPDWTHIRWAQELNQPRVHGNRYLRLTEFTITRWLNNTPDQRDYRGPKRREEYVGVAHALLQLGIIGRQEAREWLLGQGLYPLPDEAASLGFSTEDRS